ncbi:LOW QUALITY PROTEIN: proton channel OTOP3-like [Thalassophryne amazonica]|uniref:LOW QUALITY PROTEIN: proton channel OTOP3-like n=1 Tax=Thalassophryne amazonica TaxID=390379 RepID=UPI0014722BA0|nr:LOW QUALITY PROTEIN: proton channel OTOP3-like [Thalassophryne amazonica]
MNPDPAANISELDTFSGTPGNRTKSDTKSCSDEQLKEPELDPVLGWAPSGRRLISGLLGLNVVLLGAALVAGRAFNPSGLKHEEPQLFLLLLMFFSLVWMLWYLMWARNQPGICPHKDHHAGGVTVIVVLIFFAAFSVLLFISRIGYLLSMRECKPVAKVVSPFIEAPFLGLQTYLLWAHSKDCIHRHKIITRSGLMVMFSADLLLWLNAVTEDTIHQEVELEKSGSSINSSEHVDDSDTAGFVNSTFCQCSVSTACLTFRKAYEILYPFNIEYYLMAGCMVYVMWKNVGRRMSPGPHEHVTPKLTLHVIYQGGITFGLVFGALLLVVGVIVFILYQIWVSQQELRFTAFLLFYGYHLAIMPVMSVCSLVGLLVHRLERRAQENGHNPTRSLDVLLLTAAALGQLGLSYFSLVAAFALGTSGTLADLDLSYSIISLLELILQNIFIIEGLHRHPHLLAKKKDKRRSNIFTLKKKDTASKKEEGQTNVSLLDRNLSAPSAAHEHDGKTPWTKRVIQEICAFLILQISCEVLLWVIPAFGVHPQFENGLGKLFFGFTPWFILVNLGQPLAVFNRMHSVGALMDCSSLLNIY